MAKDGDMPSGLGEFAFGTNVSPIGKILCKNCSSLSNNSAGLFNIKGS